MALSFKGYIFYILRSTLVYFITFITYDSVCSGYVTRESVNLS